MTETTETPTRVGKVLPPLARQLAETMALAVGACIRPLALRRTDTETERITVIPIPCGSTREAKCPPCADRARRLRIWQAREGWHLAEEPQIETAEPTSEQLALIGYRADLEALVLPRSRRTTRSASPSLTRRSTMPRRCCAAPASAARFPNRRDRKDRPRRRVRSTRRRQDAPDLPRRRGDRAPSGRVYRHRRPTVPALDVRHPDPALLRAGPSPTAPRSTRPATTTGGPPGTRSTSPSWSTGSGRTCAAPCGWTCSTSPPSNPRRAARPAPARRDPRHHPPHAHPPGRRRDLPPGLVAAARPRGLPRRPAARSGTTGAPRLRRPATPAQPLPTWDEALDAIDDDPDAEPAHVVRFGAQVDVQGVARRHPTRPAAASATSPST